MQQNSGKICHVCHYICVWWSALGGWQEHVWHQGAVWLDVCAQMPAGVCQSIAKGCEVHYSGIKWDGVEIEQMHVSHLHTISSGRGAAGE
eukprot:4448298-Pyramimonas_sp.AAC.1